MSKYALLFLSLVTVLAFTRTPAFAGPTPGQKCAAAKQKCTVIAYAAEMKCYSKSTLTGAPLDTSCTDKARAKGIACFDKAEAKGGCNPNHVGAAHIFDDDIAVLVEDLAINDLFP